MMADPSVLIVACLTLLAGSANFIAAWYMPKPTTFQRHVFSMFDCAWKLGLGYLLHTGAHS